jgi:hypothetical protein
VRTAGRTRAGAHAEMALPDGRFLVAFGGATLDWNATFTAVDSYPNLVTSYSIDRGRQLELDRTDTGRATVQIADTDGILDPTNASGPFYGLIEPLLQAAIQRRNPVDGVWYTRFRGWISEMDYAFDPSQRVNRLTVSLVDIFEILSTIEMMPGDFGVTPPKGSEDQIFFEDNTVQERIEQILANALNRPGVDRSDYWVVFSGNVRLHETVVSPGESAMAAIQEAADAEFPGVSNVFTDRYGRLAYHGRLAKFDPVGTWESATPGAWDFRSWKLGDGAAVHADPAGTAHLRRFAFNRGLAHIINQAYATPKRNGVPMTDAEALAQIVKDETSIGLRGIRPWSAQELLTKASLVPGHEDDGDLVETKRFAQFYVANYGQPRNRTTDIAVRSILPGVSGATITWGLLSQIDIGDLVKITVGSPGGGGFNDEPYFVEGVHEQVQPLNPQMDDVTLTLDLSPQAYFTGDTSMFPEIG